MPSATGKRRKLLIDIHSLIPDDLLTSFHLSEDVAFRKQAVVLFGPAGCGKGYWAKRQPAVHLTADAMVYSRKCRLALHKTWKDRMGSKEAIKKFDNLFTRCKTIGLHVMVLAGICADHGADIIVEGTYSYELGDALKEMGFRVQCVCVIAPPDVAFNNIKRREASNEPVVSFLMSMNTYEKYMRQHYAPVVISYLDFIFHHELGKVRVVDSDGTDASGAFVGIVGTIVCGSLRGTTCAPKKITASIP